MSRKKGRSCAECRGIILQVEVAWFSRAKERLIRPRVGIGRRGRKVILFLSHWLPGPLRAEMVWRGSDDADEVRLGVNPSVWLTSQCDRLLEAAVAILEKARKDVRQQELTLNGRRL